MAPEHVGIDIGQLLDNGLSALVALVIVLPIVWFVLRMFKSSQEARDKAFGATMGRHTAAIEKIADKITALPDRSDIDRALTSCSVACSHERAAQDLIWGEKIAANTEVMTRVADGLDKHNGDLTYAIRELGTLPSTITLAVHRGFHDQDLGKRLADHQARINRLKEKLKMTSDGEAFMAVSSEIAKLEKNPPLPY